VGRWGSNWWKMKILNLYAGIGGNRKLWGDDHEITAVEIDPKIAAIYSDFYPNDQMVVGDAHAYLEDHFMDYDFIWSSPPCQSHSNMRQNLRVRFNGSKPMFADMRLYQEILLLMYNFKGKWVVENVIPYYVPLIKPTTKLQRHLFWCNYHIREKWFQKEVLRNSQIPQLSAIHGVNLDAYKLSNKRQVLRNAILPELGLHVFEHAQFDLPSDLRLC
jgi:DNA (cytosine-5)-methyltransferase 1